MKLSGIPPGTARPRCRTVAITGGKGGVGKTTIAINLAAALARVAAARCCWMAT